MKNNKKFLIMCILGLALSAKAQPNQKEYVLITIEDIKKIAKKKIYSMDIEDSLLTSGVIKNKQGECYYEIDLPSLDIEKKYALDEGNLELVDLLTEVTDNQTIITIRKPKDMKAAPQDFSPILCE